MEENRLKTPQVVGKTENGNEILFWSGGFPGSHESGKGNSIFEIVKT